MAAFISPSSLIVVATSFTFIVFINTTAEQNYYYTNINVKPKASILRTFSHLSITYLRAFKLYKMENVLKTKFNKTVKVFTLVLSAFFCSHTCKAVEGKKWFVQLKMYFVRNFSLLESFKILFIFTIIYPSSPHLYQNLRFSTLTSKLTLLTFTGLSILNATARTGQ